MSALLALLGFAGHVALLLWGVHMVQTGMQRAYGAALGATLHRALATRLRGLMAGLAITAALQSSTATGLMITGLSAGGAIALVPALAAMLGANVGTTLIVQALSFDLTALAPILILLGVALFRRNPPGAQRDSGRIFIGLGLLLTALHQMVAVLAPLEQTAFVRLVLDSLSNQPIAAVLIAAALTWLAHSSVAVVILIMSLASHGFASPSLAYALVLGANLGTAINPLLEGVSGNDPAMRRLPLGNLLTRVVGVIVGLLILPWLDPDTRFAAHDSARAVANIHTLFNVGLALLFLPLLAPYAQLLSRWLPKQQDPNDPGQPRYLDESVHDIPAIALGNAAREALRMADMLQTLLQYARAGFKRDKRQRAVQARQLSSALDRLETRITAYLARPDHDNMTREDRQRLGDILTFAAHMGRAADGVQRGLLAQVNLMRKQGLTFSDEQLDCLDATIQRLIRSNKQSAALFVSEDLAAARALAAEKTWFRQQGDSATEAHIQRIKHGDIDAAEVQSLYLDILRALQSINADIVSAAAYPQLARHGELLSSRVREAAHEAPHDITPPEA